MEMTANKMQNSWSCYDVEMSYAFAKAIYQNLKSYTQPYIKLSIVLLRTEAVFELNRSQKCFQTVP